MVPTSFIDKNITCEKDNKIVGRIKFPCNLGDKIVLACNCSYHINIKMLYYDRINDSERIHLNKINELRKCIICSYCYFLKVNFKFQLKVCDGCHDLMQKTLSFNDAAICLSMILDLYVIIEFIFRIRVQMEIYHKNE